MRNALYKLPQQGRFYIFAQPEHVIILNHCFESLPTVTPITPTSQKGF